MTPIFPTIRLMTPEETRTSRLINAGSVIDYEEITIPIYPTKKILLINPDRTLIKKFQQ